MKKITHAVLSDIQQVLSLMQNQSFIDSVDTVGKALIGAYQHGQTLFIAGNGGSWADADHFAGELRAQFEIQGRQALPALAVPISLSTITAWGNDYENGFEEAMERDLQAFAKTGDILIAISTSGKAKNIRRALTWARNNGVLCIGISGNGPRSDEFGQLTDHHIVIPHDRTARVQEGYQIIIHILCMYIDTLGTVK